MTKRKYFSINVFLSAIITIVYALSLIFLFREQAKYDGVVNVKLSDLPAHIRAGLQPGSAYSLMYVILGFLWRLPHRCFLISLTLTLFSLVSIYFTFILLKHLVHGKISNEKLYLAALICNMSMPIYIPVINEHRYLGMLTFNLYHNSTYIAMKPFALLSLLLFFKLFRKYHARKISFLEWLGFSVSLFLATWFKPSFTLAFAFCMLIIMIFDFINGKGKNIFNYLVFGTTVFPALALILWQKSQLFDDNSKLAFGLFKVWSIYTKNPYTALLLSVAFPLVVLIFNYRDLIKDKIYGFGWLLGSFNIAIYALLYETGVRLMDGNFGWGAQFAVGVLFVVSLYKLLSKIKTTTVYRLTVISAVLGMHVLSWVSYYIVLLYGGSYY